MAGLGVFQDGFNQVLDNTGIGAQLVAQYDQGNPFVTWMANAGTALGEPVSLGQVRQDAKDAIDNGFAKVLDGTGIGPKLVESYQNGNKVLEGMVDFTNGVQKTNDQIEAAMASGANIVKDNIETGLQISAENIKNADFKNNPFGAMQIYGTEAVRGALNIATFGGSEAAMKGIADKMFENDPNAAASIAGWTAGVYERAGLVTDGQTTQVPEVVRAAGSEHVLPGSYTAMIEEQKALNAASKAAPEVKGSAKTIDTVNIAPGSYTAMKEMQKAQEAQAAQMGTPKMPEYTGAVAGAQISETGEILRHIDPNKDDRLGAGTLINTIQDAHYGQPTPGHAIHQVGNQDITNDMQRLADACHESSDNAVHMIEKTGLDFEGFRSPADQHVPAVEDRGFVNYTHSLIESQRMNRMSEAFKTIGHNLDNNTRALSDLINQRHLNMDKTAQRVAALGGLGEGITAGATKGLEMGS